MVRRRVEFQRRLRDSISSSARWYRLGVALGLTSAASAGHAQSIAPRSCHAMTYSSAAGGVIAAGGARACGVDVLADSAIWVWTGSRWGLTGATLPSPREDALVAYDPRRRILLLYGGRMAGTVHADTWVLEGSQWHRRAGATDAGPGQVEHAALGFDERRGRAVVFGGGSRDGRLFDATWEWDGSAWTRANPPLSPPGRVGHSMAWSATDNAVLLYGGFNAAGPFRDLWKWDGSTWTRLDSAGPALTEGPALVAGDGGAVLVGPPAATPGATLGVWAWRAAQWVRLDSGTGPPARVGQGVGYDGARKRIVLFGGSDQATNQSDGVTWEFDGRRWQVASAAAR
jgi:hypothetical protein